MNKIIQIIILVFFSLLMMSSSCDKGLEGCTDTEACNFDSTAVVEDGSCQYPEANHDCESNCISNLDCMGVCGGTAETDCCGFCDSDEANDPPKKSDGSCQDLITYYDESDELPEGKSLGDIKTEPVECGCIDLTQCNGNPNANYDDGSCFPDLSEFGGSLDGYDCNHECGGLAVVDNCELCVGGTTEIGESWRLKIISEATFKLSNDLQIGSYRDSVTLGSSIFAKDGYNGVDLDEGDPSSNTKLLNLYMNQFEDHLII
jgi:hypothetical protein